MPLEFSASLVKELKRVLLSCMELNSSTKGLLYVLDMSTGEFRLTAFYGYLKRTPAIERYEFDHPLLRLIFEKRKPFMVNALENYPDLRDHFRSQDVYNAQVTPIYLQDRIYAFIEERNRGGRKYYDEDTLAGAKRVAEEMMVVLERAITGKTTRQGSPEEEAEKSTQYLLVRAASFRRYLPVVSTYFQDSVLLLKNAVSFDLLVLNLLIGERSINLVYSHRPLGPDSRQLIQNSLAEFFPFLGSGDNVSTHFYVERMDAEPQDARVETFYTLNSLERNGVSAYLSAIRFTPGYFEGEDIAALSKYSRMMGSYLSQVIREYRCFDTYIGLILNLLELSKSSGHTFRVHALNTAKYARALAEKMSDDLDFVDAVTIAALLHDIGILLIDPDLFEKESVINITDFEKIKDHTRVSLKFLEKIRVPKDIRAMIKSHHERMDGTGYPDGLEGAEIPLGARIIAVAEAFEVMTGKSGYRKSMSVRGALKEIIAQKGKQFDPEVVQVLSEIAGSRKEETQ